MASIRSHENNGQGWCRHCGAPMRPDILLEATCLQRTLPLSELRPAPARRPIACEDAAAISARIAELQASRTEALNRAEEQQA